MGTTHDSGAAAAAMKQIDTYRPSDNPPGWRRVAGEVRATATQAASSVPYPADEVMGVLAKLGLFAEAEGQPLQASLWLSREYIERFIQVGCASLGQATRGNYRSKLLRLREMVLGGDLVTGEPARFHSSRAAPPYTAGEQTALWAWASGQPTADLRNGLTVLLALGLGCGVDSSELALLRAGDIRAATTRQASAQAEDEPDSERETSPEGRCGSHGPLDEHQSDDSETPCTMVAVRGRRPRLVVCRHSWEGVLAGQAALAAARHGTAAYMFRPGVPNRGGNLVTNFVSRAHPAPGTPDLKTSRLRATWLIGLIDAGVPLPLITAASGLKTLHGLSRLIHYAKPADPARATHLLRGDT